MSVDDNGNSAIKPCWQWCEHPEGMVPKVRVYNIEILGTMFFGNFQDFIN